MPEQEVREDINPQLCKTLNPAKHKWEHSWIAEPKFDGLRCIVIVEKPGTAQAYSRNGKPLYNMNHILLEAAARCPKNTVLDGEVYTKDWNLSMGIVKSSVTKHPDADQLRYHVWDCLRLGEWKAGRSDVSNQDRKERLFALFQHSTYIQMVASKEVHNDEELKKAYTDFLAQGFEGAILKHPQGAYECGRRSPNWLKIKPWTDADLTIVGAYPGEGKHIGRIGGLILSGIAEWNGTSYNVSTEVGTGFTDAEREAFQEMWDKNILLGKIVEIKFQDITVDGACRFPVYNRLREDK